MRTISQNFNNKIKIFRYNLFYKHLLKLFPFWKYGKYFFNWFLTSLRTVLTS